MKDYTEKAAEKMPSCAPNTGAFKSDAPFKDETTQRVDYKQWPTDRPYVHEPEQYRRPDGDFDFNTTHKKAYTKKPIAARVAVRPPSRKREAGKFNGATTTKEDY